MKAPILQILDAIKNTAVKFTNEEVTTDALGPITESADTSHSLNSHIEITMRFQPLCSDETGNIVVFIPIAFSHYLSNHYFDENTPLNSRASSVKRVPLHIFFKLVEEQMDDHYKDLDVEKRFIFQTLSDIGICSYDSLKDEPDAATTYHFNLKAGEDSFHFSFSFDDNAVKMFNEISKNKTAQIENVNTSVAPVEKQLDDSLEKS